jgi:GT2 family glycosyltransferase
MLNIFSFIVISYNRVEETIDAVKNILSLDNIEHWKKEIIVLNNNSTQDYGIFSNYLNSIPVSDKYDINYIHHTENLGVAGGRNFCIKKATGKYLFFLDDDAEIVQKNLIQLVLDKYKKYENENLAIIGCLGKNPYTNEWQTPIKNPKLMNNRNEIFYYLFYGFGHVFPKSLIEKTGYYQDDFFYGMEENDLAFATIKAGNAILFTNDILILHKVNPNGREPNITTQSRYFQNRLIVVYKHLPFVYVCTQFIMWSLYFLFHTKFNLKYYVLSLLSLKKRLKNVDRQVMPKSGMEYLKKVQARLWY